MKRFGLVILLLFLCAATPASQPVSLELRANAAFDRGEYAAALVLYQKLQDESKGEPDKVSSIAERIRVCQKQLIKSGVAEPTSIPTAAERKPHAPPKPEEIRDLTIQDLGNFEYDADKGGNIPADVVALSGSKLRVKGFMVPMDQADNVTEFALVPSLFACCFGQPPQLQHTIICATPKGKSVTYYPDELTVEGTLKVDEKKDEGFIVSVFELEVSSVKPAAK